MSKSTDPIPAYLQQFPGLSVRRGDAIVPAPDADVAVARGYATASTKGDWKDGRRISVLTAGAANGAVRIIHVVESTRAGDSLYVMGPKAILGEYVDDKLVTAAAPTTGDPLVPAGVYDGRVVPAPGVDYNYDVTEYKLSAGKHTVEWRLGELRSNQLVIEIGR